MAKRVLAALLLANAGCVFNEAAVVVGDTSQYEVEHRRHEESIANLMANMTVETALGLLARDPAATPQLMGLVQNSLRLSRTDGSRVKLGQAPAAPEHAAQVASVTDRLNEMIFEVQAKYELEHQKCCEYDRTKRLLIEETAQDIALFNAESAQARSGILGAQTQLSIGNARVPKLQESLQQNTQKCNAEVQALEAQLSIVLNDIPVLTSILEMTDCGHPDNQEDPSKKVKALLVKAGTQMSPTTRTMLEESLQKHEEEMALVATSNGTAHLLTQHSAQRLRRVHKHGRHLQQPQTTVAPKTVPTGPCALPNAADKAKAKCAVGPANCGKLNERFLSIQVSLIDRRDHLKQEVKALQDTCKATNEALSNQIAGYSANVMAAQTSLARWTKVQNSADEQNRLKTVEKGKMEKEFKEMTETCRSSYLGFESQECGLRKIRGELAKLKNNSLTPYFQDCQVSAWSPDACSASCGGGRQSLKRSIVTPPKQGVKCLPLERIQTCNTHACPIDCKQADWAAWSGCTAECGGGIQQREREAIVKARYGGKPCGDSSETRSCNIQSCNQDCVLNEWNEWSGCSKACGNGRQRRLRTVKEAARGTGKCAGEREESRVQFRACNTNSCPANLRCRSNLDVILVLDGAGGAGDGAWTATKNAAVKLVTGLGGVGGANVAVLAFGGPTNWKGIAACTGEGPAGANVDTEKVCKLSWISHFTSDITGIKDKLVNLPRPEGSRLTSAALGLADGAINIGRKDVPAVVLVITDGRPLNLGKTHFIAAQLRKRARLTFVAAGSSAPVDLLRNLASRPDDENVLVVQDYNALQTEVFVDHVVATLCPQVGEGPVPLIAPTFTNALTYPQLNAALDRDASGASVCGQGRHVCNYQEVTVLSVRAGFDAPKTNAWIVGGFPNIESHRRSVWNGQDSTQCKDGNYPAWWAKWGPYLGRVHCHNGGESRPVACCGNVNPKEDPSTMRVSGWTGTYGTLNQLLDQDNNGGNVCGGGFHICNFQEVTMYGPVLGSSPEGWIVGGFSNWEAHRRSVWNGQDSTQCQPGNYPFSYPPFGPYFGRVHCSGQAAIKRATCCVNRLPNNRPEIVRLNGKVMNYNTLNSQLDSDWQGRSTCGQDWHVCNYQEVTVYMSTAGLDVGQQAWIVGGFSNMEAHRRSIWNGQDGLLCRDGQYPFVFTRWNNYYGRVHCGGAGENRQVLCCRDDGYKNV